jgi:hypothetical protein
MQRGVLISEGVWPNGAFVDGQGFNVLTGDDSPAPFGGAAVHETGRGRGRPDQSAAEPSTLLAGDQCAGPSRLPFELSY